jgi:hypothetical protein
METVGYKTTHKEKARVRLNRPDLPENSQTAVIIRVLENPSHRREHQWYDVRFDSGVLGRFLERYLEPVAEAGDQRKTFEGSQTSAA